MIKQLAGLIMTLALVACGGGGGGGGSGNNPPTGGGGINPPAGGGGTSLTYEAIPTPLGISRADLLSQLNAQGARGFKFFGANGLGGVDFNFYNQDNNSTYTYEILNSDFTTSGMLAQMNAQGARGFRFEGPYEQGTVYSRESTGETLNYQLLLQPATNAAFETQNNSQGASGYLYIGPLGLNPGTGTVTYSVFEKVNGSSAVYNYRVLADTNNFTDLLNQANTQGQAGYKFGGRQFVSAFFALYVKDTSQNASFSWKTNTEATTANDLVTQANAEGTQGFAYWFSFFANSTSPEARELYFKPSNCAGLLCRTVSPL